MLWTPKTCRRLRNVLKRRDKALAIIRALNERWSTEKASYQTQNTHTKESFYDILETLRNIENERSFNPSQAEQVEGTSLALSAEQPKRPKAETPKTDKEVQPSKSQESTSGISHLEERMEEMALFVKSMKRFMKKGYKGERSDRKSTRLNSSHRSLSRMPSSA